MNNRGNMSFTNKQEIESRKHFNAILVSLKTVSDILKNIDQLCASKHCNMHMLSNSIRLKAPEIHKAFTDYRSIYGFENGNIPFGEWAIANKLIPIEVIEVSKNGKDIRPFSELKIALKAMQNSLKKAKLTTPKKVYNDEILICSRCERKFPSSPPSVFADHICIKPKKKKTIWVVSGGGANGIRNRR